jgi:hypothetical protein
MEHVKESLRLRLEYSHQHARAAATALFVLGCLSVFFLNHSSQATSTFWHSLISFVVNLVPKADYRYFVPIPCAAFTLDLMICVLQAV